MKGADGVLKKWDPSWGWNGEVYYLGTGDAAQQFFMAAATLYRWPASPVPIAISARMCAGTFDDIDYYGSCSHDICLPNELDQEIFLSDREWSVLSRLRLSDVMQEPHPCYGNRRIEGRWVYGFRDPCRIPDGDIAVVTGGDRWNTLGNVCSVRSTDSGFELGAETILDKSMMRFGEIERVCFWDDWMFFSAGGGAAPAKAHSPFFVAKRKGTLYSFFGEVENSGSCYGMDLKDGRRAIYWERERFDIVVPSEPNLTFVRGTWRLRRRKTWAEHWRSEVVNLGKLILRPVARKAG
jgi:hypothetical protein